MEVGENFILTLGFLWCWLGMLEPVGRSWVLLIALVLLISLVLPARRHRGSVSPGFLLLFPWTLGSWNLK